MLLRGKIVATEFFRHREISPNAGELALRRGRFGPVSYPPGKTQPKLLDVGELQQRGIYPVYDFEAVLDQAACLILALPAALRTERNIGRLRDFIHSICPPPAPADVTDKAPDPQPQQPTRPAEDNGDTATSPESFDGPNSDTLK